jgi:hypothetical protein
MMRIGKKIRSAVLVLGIMAIAGISVSASDFAGRTLNEGGVIAPAVLPAASTGVVATQVQFRRPMGYYDRWGIFHYYPWVYSGRSWNYYRFRRGDRDDYYRFHRDWDDRHRRDWDDHYRRFDRR